MAGGVAVLAFDRDGKPDLFFANGAEQPSFEKRTDRITTGCIAIVAIGFSRM